jgi:hypothetical protein
MDLVSLIEGWTTGVASMRVANDEPGDGPFAELVRMQAEFQTRLLEETTRYLRQLQGVFEPRAPGTVLRADSEALVSAPAPVGETVEMCVEVENRQRAHTMVTPSVTPLVEPNGTTFFPAAEFSPPSRLLAPNEVTLLTFRLPLPAELTPGTYRGMLVLQGFREGGVPLVVQVCPSQASP